MRVGWTLVICPRPYFDGSCPTIVLNAELNREVFAHHIDECFANCNKLVHSTVCLCCQTLCVCTASKFRVQGGRGDPCVQRVGRTASRLKASPGPAICISTNGVTGLYTWHKGAQDHRTEETQMRWCWISDAVCSWFHSADSRCVAPQPSAFLLACYRQVGPQSPHCQAEAGGPCLTGLISKALFPFPSFMPANSRSRLLSSVLYHFF